MLEMEPGQGMVPDWDWGRVRVLVQVRVEVLAPEMVFPRELQDLGQETVQDSEMATARGLDLARVRDSVQVQDWDPVRVLEREQDLDWAMEEVQDLATVKELDLDWVTEMEPDPVKAQGTVPDLDWVMVLGREQD
jgi:hypothetical protein